ncbi:MAG: phosphatidylserine decarboxylase, partial [Chlorobiales bacterium]|nr:phosphatidylserine decarboxylase [Chlorobiales bacterium]
MKGRIFERKERFLSIVLLLGMLFSASTAFSGGKHHKAITKELIQLINEQPEIGKMLETSIAKAKKINPDRETNPAQSLSEYYDFIDRASELLPQDVLKGPSESVRDQMLQGICYFYFLVDQPLGELKGKGLYKNAIQYYPPFSSWLRKYADTWGMFLDTEASWNEEVYQQIYNDPAFG